MFCEQLKYNFLIQTIVECEKIKPQAPYILFLMSICFVTPPLFIELWIPL